MAMFDGLLLLALYVLAQGLTLWAFVDALVRPAPGFLAAGKSPAKATSARVTRARSAKPADPTAVPAKKN